MGELHHTSALGVLMKRSRIVNAKPKKGTKNNERTRGMKNRTENTHIFYCKYRTRSGPGEAGTELESNKDET
jgi:hypothetical protein